MENAMVCKKCNSDKKSKYCNNCKLDTPTSFGKELTEKISLSDQLRNLLKSATMVFNKPVREIEQYAGNKDRDVISEFERRRFKNKKTVVIHRLWRRIGNNFKKVHEHKK